MILYSIVLVIVSIILFYTAYLVIWNLNESEKEIRKGEEESRKCNELLERLNYEKLKRSGK